MTVDQKSPVQTFLKNLHSICSETQKERLVDLLISKFKESKKGQQMVENSQRQCLLHAILLLVESVSKDVLQVVLEHFFSLREETDV
jgi:hypothetical protein